MSGKSSRWLQEIKNPSSFIKFAYFRLLTNLYRRRSYKNDSIFSREWDTLIVLDACRYDVFESIVGPSGYLDRIKSPGSSTPEWLEGNFLNQDLSEIVYISGNPYTGIGDFLDRLEDTGFHKIIDVWKTGWNEKEGTVYPTEINKNALRAMLRYPDKKFILHYMQPHYPFVGQVRLPASGMIKESFFDREIKDTHSVWYRLKEGQITKEEVWIAYVSNLLFVLKAINKILPYLAGRVCVTSDHGNVFGKHGVFYGHPPRTYLDELINVPWFEVQDKEKFRFKAI